MTTPCHRPGCLKPADIRHGDLMLCAAHYKTAPEVAR